MLGLITMASATNSMRHKRTRKGQLTSSACLQCRRRKTKCSGGRPACLRCSDRGDICTYDTEEGMSRQQGLRTQLRRREDQITRMRIVFRVLQFESDAQAAELLFRLRSKCEVEKTINTKKRLLHSDRRTMRANDLHVTRFRNLHPNQQSLAAHALIQTLSCMKTRSKQLLFKTELPCLNIHTISWKANCARN